MTEQLGNNVLQSGNNPSSTTRTRYSHRRGPDPMPIITLVLSVVAIIVSVISLLVSFNIIPVASTDASDSNSSDTANGETNDEAIDATSDDETGAETQERVITFDNPVEVDTEGWHIALTGAVITNDISGNEAIVLVYEATNNTGDNDSPSFLNSTEMYQNGVNLNYTTMDNEYYSEYNRIQPGITTTIYVAAELDDDSPVDVECPDEHSDTLFTTTIDISDGAEEAAE